MDPILPPLTCKRESRMSLNFDPGTALRYAEAIARLRLVHLVHKEPRRGIDAFAMSKV